MLDSHAYSNYIVNSFVNLLQLVKNSQLHYIVHSKFYNQKNLDAT